MVDAAAVTGGATQWVNERHKRFEVGIAKEKIPDSHTRNSAEHVLNVKDQECMVG